jgi:integrase
MSVRANRYGGYDVLWRDETGRQRSRTFRRKRDAERYDLTVKDRKARGTLAFLDAGTETLDDYVAETWAPIHVATLAPGTRRLYTKLYDGHISPTLGRYPLRDLTPEVIGRWQADRLAAGVPAHTLRQTRTLLGGILQRAMEAGRIAVNNARLVRPVPRPPTAEVRPLSPARIEAIRAVCEPRAATVVSVLAYAGLRPQEARALRWGHVLGRTLVVHAPKTRRHRPEPRSVRLLAPLAADLRQWRMASGRPGDDAPVFPARMGGEWTDVGFDRWREETWRPALAGAGLAYQRPYDLRHSFASLLLHEGRSVIYVARQLGHGAELTMKTYGHVMEDLEDAPRISAEDAVAAARRGKHVGAALGRP